MPGEIEWERFAAAQANGISLPSDVLTSLLQAAEIARLDLGDYLARSHERT